MPVRALDAEVSRLARRQHGTWTRRQALEVGLSPKMVRTRIASGLWVPLDTGVYCGLDTAPTWERSVMAAVLAESQAVASHQSAAVLHGLAGFRPGRPVITVPPGAHARSHLALVHRGIDVQSTEVRGIPCSSLTQVFVDLAQVVRPSRVAPALADQADRCRWLLDAVRDRYCELAPRGGRNLRGLRATLDQFGAGDLPSESALERVMRTVFDVPEIPPIRWQAPFPGRQPGSQRVDGLIEEWATILEGDGRAWHTRIADFERDRRRDAEAAAAGLQTLRFTWFQLTEQAGWSLRILLDVGIHRAA